MSFTQTRTIKTEPVSFGYVVAGKFIETGTTKRGAKIAASKAGADNACYKDPDNGLVYAFATKKGSKWA